MEYIECVIFTNHSGAEIVGEILGDSGVSGFQTEDHEELKDFLQNNVAFYEVERGQKWNI